MYLHLHIPPDSPTVISLQIFKTPLLSTSTNAHPPPLTPDRMPACNQETNRWLTQISQGNIKLDDIKLQQGD